MPESDAAPQVVGVRQVDVGGVTYQISRVAAQENRYKVETLYDRPGSKTGAATAVIQAYGCQRARVTETMHEWRQADAVGTFCRDSDWVPMR